MWILRVMSGSNPVAGIGCPKLHWWCSWIFNGKHLMGNVGAGWQGWKATSMPGARHLISTLMQNSHYSLLAIPQSRTFNEKKKKRDWPSRRAESSFTKKWKVHFQNSILKYRLAHLHNKNFGSPKESIHPLHCAAGHRKPLQRTSERCFKREMRHHAAWVHTKGDTFLLRGADLM